MQFNIIYYVALLTFALETVKNILVYNSKLDNVLYWDNGQTQSIWFNNVLFIEE